MPALKDLVSTTAENAYARRLKIRDLIEIICIVALVLYVTLFVVYGNPKQNLIAMVGGLIVLCLVGNAFRRWAADRVIDEACVTSRTQLMNGLRCHFERAYLKASSNEVGSSLVILIVDLNTVDASQVVRRSSPIPVPAAIEPHPTQNFTIALSH